jgi:hypothetical protein
MARTDDDSWDITESVGATALGVAMARAGYTPRVGPPDGYCESWNSIIAATESTASLNAANRSAAVGAASTE